MTLIRKLASVLLLASWLTSGSTNSQELTAGQTYTTGNIVSNTPNGGPSSWNNGVYQDNLTCWAWGNPGYCGPNAIVRPNNNINFSFGVTDLNQVKAIASVLPDNGSGLRVNGFNFGFTAKNGNGWDDSRQDYLAAYVKFYGADGTIAKSYDYSAVTNQRYNWTTFNFSETFTTPYATKDLSTVQYGLIGRDNNGWAGPYGPEVYGVNFSLKYSVDPCAKDVLSSPTCPGYMDALNKLTGASTTSTSASSTGSVAPTTATVTTVTETPTASTTTNTASGPPPAAVSADVLSKVTESTKTTVTASAASITAATNLNDKSSVTAFALSVISKNAANEKTLQDKAVSEAVSQANAAATAAVEQSQSIAITQSQASAAASSPAQGAGAIATVGPGPGVNTAASAPAPGANAGGLANNAVGMNNSASSMQSSALLPPVTNTQSTTENNGFNNGTVPTTNVNNAAVVVTAPPVPTLVELLPPVPQQQTQQNPAQGLSVAISTTPFAAAPTFVAPAPVIEPPRLSESDSNRNIDMSSPTDFVAGYLNTKNNLNDMQAPVMGPTVNSKAQDNEAAGGVTISAMATMPVGYDLYTSLAIKDAAFYKPEELYRGQKTVDNQRLLRGLTGASDRVHQEMVDEQYKNK